MQIAVLGAELMGHALALVYALGGHTVRITDNNHETLERSRGAMQVVLATLREGNEVDASWTETKLAAAVTPCATLSETLTAADIIVEAITEQPDAKRALYAEIDTLAPMSAIIASNTSALDISPLVPRRR